MHKMLNVNVTDPPSSNFLGIKALLVAENPGTTTQKPTQEHSSQSLISRRFTLTEYLQSELASESKNKEPMHVALSLH